MSRRTNQSNGRFFRTSELIIIGAGLLFLANVAVSITTGNLTLWFAAVFLYAVGALLFIINR